MRLIIFLCDSNNRKIFVSLKFIASDSLLHHNLRCINFGQARTLLSWGRAYKSKTDMTGLEQYLIYKKFKFSTDAMKCHYRFCNSNAQLLIDSMDIRSLLDMMKDEHDSYITRTLKIKRQEKCLPHFKRSLIQSLKINLLIV